MHEEILATFIRGDNAVTLLTVETLDCSLGYILEPTFLVSGLQQTKSYYSYLGSAPFTLAQPLRGNIP
jgi:hypothetical protein